MEWTNEALKKQTWSIPLLEIINWIQVNLFFYLITGEKFKLSKWQWIINNDVDQSPNSRVLSSNDDGWIQNLVKYPRSDDQSVSSWRKSDYAKQVRCHELEPRWICCKNDVSHHDGVPSLFMVVSEFCFAEFAKCKSVWWN